MNRERDFEAAPLDAQTLETIRLLAEELIAPVSEYEPYVPGSQKSLLERMAPFAALDRMVAASFAKEDAKAQQATGITRNDGAPSPSAPSSSTSEAQPTARARTAATASPGKAEPMGGRLSVLLEQLQERAKLRRQRGQSPSRLIKAEDFERREPTIGASKPADEATAGEADGPRLSFEP